MNSAKPPAGKREKKLLTEGLDPNRFYPFLSACKLVGLGAKHIEILKQKHKGGKVLNWGHDCCIYGKDLIEIITQEAAGGPDNGSVS